MNANTFDRISFLSLFLIIVLLSFFFLPFTSIPVETSKGLLLVAGLAICVICWCLARFFDGRINFPRSASLLSGGGVVLAFLLSAAFSKSPQVSFFGTMFDIGTFWFIFSGFLLMLMCSIILRDSKKAKIILLGAILSSAVVLIFQTARLFMPEVLSLGVLTSKTSNILGSWNALGIFAGFSALMLLLVIEFFSTTRMEKLILQALAILSILMVAVVNFPFVWELLGILSLIIFVYKASTTSRGKAAEDNADVLPEKAHFPTFSFIIIMIALLFFMSGDAVGGIIPSRLGVQNTEISPSFSATMVIAKSVLKENPVFGVGPNKFDVAWGMYKPATINTTPFWDVSFNSGSGLLPTFASTVGSLGILAFLIFFILFITSGVKSIFSSVKNSANWEIMAFFVLSLYLFISSFFYSVGPVIFLLALAFAGVFIGLSSSKYQNGEISISYLNDHRKSFFSILSIVVLLIITAGLSFKYAERLASVSYFSRAVAAQDLSEATASISKALALYENDLYLRIYAQIYLAKFNSLAIKDAGTLSDDDKALLQSSLDQAVRGAQSAAAYNPKNYLNFQALGSLYQSLASLGVKDAYSKAVEAYKKASALNPNNPGLKLSAALALFADKKNAEAKDYANTAITLKPDYTDAFVVLSQIAKSEGNSESALSYGETALSISPANADLIKYVDSLKNKTIVPPTASTSKKP